MVVLGGWGKGAGSRHGSRRVVALQQNPRFFLSGVFDCLQASRLGAK
jgi:hypothetical protein